MICLICQDHLMCSKAKTCSKKECKNKWKLIRLNNRPLNKKSCPICGSSFQTKDSRTNYCSYACKHKAASNTMQQKYGYRNPMEKPKTHTEKVDKSLKDLESLSKRKERQKAYYQANKHNWKRYQKQYNERRDYLKAYYYTEKGQELARRGRERRRQRTEGNPYLKIGEVRLLTALVPYCINCGSDSKLTLDHHVPVMLGGKLTIDNTMILCKSCNSQKLDKHPNIFYNDYKLSRINGIFNEIQNYKNNKPKLILLTGVSGSGKTWICNQLRDYTILCRDSKSEQDIISCVVVNPNGKNIVSLTIGVSTFLRRYHEFFDIKVVVINEKPDVIKNRLELRGGSINNNIYKRIARFIQISKWPSTVFSGTSEDALNYFKFLK